MNLRTLCALPALVAGMLFPAAPAEDLASSATSVHAFTLLANDGTPYPMAQHRGKVLLLVNTASRCGFTKQYASLERVWLRYHARGLVVIGVPSNDFLGQEPGTDAEIRQFCTLKYQVTFPLMAKVAVSGKDQAPIYQYLTNFSAKPGKISWNFNKFLIGPDGKVIDRFGSRDEPEAPDVVAAIERALEALK